MVTLLVILVTLLPLACAVRASVSHEGLRVNHVTLFSFGAVFYWVSPIIMGEGRLFADDPALRLWYVFFDTHTTDARIVAYCVVITGFYLAFVAGSWVGDRVPLPAHPERVFPFAPRLATWVVPVALIPVAIYAFALRSEFFTGYSRIWNADSGPRGTFTAAAMFLLGVVFLRVVLGPDTGRPWWRNGAVISFAAVSVLLLSLGGRLYVVSAVLMAVVYTSCFVRRLRIRRAALGALAGLAGAGLTGIVRLGGQLSPLAAAANVASEPLFTSFSLLQFLSRGSFEWWNWPRFLLGDLLNLVPSALLPSKAQYLLDPEAFGYVVFSPLGALNSFFSLVINFGTVGALIPLFLLGMLLALLARQPAPLLRIVYAMLSGWLAFTFFRDPFSVSLVKNMLEFGFLVPIGVAASLHVLHVAAARQQTPLSAIEPSARLTT